MYFFFKLCHSPYYSLTALEWVLGFVNLRETPQKIECVHYFWIFDMPFRECDGPPKILLTLKIEYRVNRRWIVDLGSNKKYQVHVINYWIVELPFSKIDFFLPVPLQFYRISWSCRLSTVWIFVSDCWIAFFRNFIFGVLVLLYLYYSLNISGQMELF